MNPQKNDQSQYGATCNVNKKQQVMRACHFITVSRFSKALNSALVKINIMKLMIYEYYPTTV